MPDPVKSRDLCDHEAHALHHYTLCCEPVGYQATCLGCGASTGLAGSATLAVRQFRARKLVVTRDAEFVLALRQAKARAGMLADELGPELLDEPEAQ